MLFSVRKKVKEPGRHNLNDHEHHLRVISYQAHRRIMGFMVVKEVHPVFIDRITHLYRLDLLLKDLSRGGK